ncbi:MAG: hypothetical protein Tsb002_34580 [Wenzhouxiangellaceae bacterium]
MIVEKRTYKIKTGLLNDFWELYKNEGLPIQLEYQKKPLGFYFVELGELSTFIHMWEYKDYEERQECRERLHKNKKWLVYAKKSHKYIESMKSTILVPLAFL